MPSKSFAIVLKKKKTKCEHLLNELVGTAYNLLLFYSYKL